ncbi:pentatricopeptide repeat-containing protein At2g44880-like [Cynara cardunculus var. scolymus]|uniref:pentatricopeptide repeat-containing protein At2g44880-like n=1 Tax=Cynara cardunculus var. scolymus TaxID=59895 RepID=UPI000D629C0A|nr:pentatricopeptide repeat-containing protein At2g44880-like [Cynara cardunculus var. scolymus]
MQETGTVVPDNFTFPVLLKAVSNLSYGRIGLALHAQIVKTGFDNHLLVQTSLLNMYSSVQRIDEARKVFDGMQDKDLVAWNSMLDAYVSIQKMDFATQLFRTMPQRDLLSYNIMVSGYSKIGDMDCARAIFDEIPQRDTISWNSLILACGNHGDMVEARKVFDEMPQRNVISWNTLLGAYLKNGLFEEVILIFEKMKAENTTSPDHLTITTSLSACAQLGLLEKGRQIHVYAQDSRLVSSPHVTTSLIDMYAKCGCVESFLTVFYKSKVRDVYCWNALISGLALHGYGVAALKVYDEMLQSTNPDDITFIALLSACSHSGLIEEGQTLFDSMEIDHGVARKMEHYGCLVDLLGRAGFLESAYTIIATMPFRAGKSVLGALLGACVNYRDLEIGEKVVKILVNDGFLNDGDYMMVSNLYASCDRWDDANCWRAMMNNSGIVKAAGSSSIEVANKMHKFLAGNSS